MEEILKLTAVSKIYKSGDKALKVVDGVDFSVSRGQTLSIVGPSGSGKTTLLGLCAGLDQVSEGTISLCGSELSGLTENQRAELRNKKVGFVFQNFQLIPTLTALENVMVPVELLGEANPKAKAMELLDRVGLKDRMTHYPSQLSGGEQQRVSIARAFINTPDILFADEPTGNLDDATGDKIEELLFSINREHHTTLILVTHDMELARKTDRIIKLKGGHIVSDSNQEIDA